MLVTRAAVELHLLHQHAAQRLQDVALDLGAHAVGIDDLPAIVRADHALDLDPAACALDRDLHAHRHIGLAVLVVHVGDAASARDGGALAGCRARAAVCHFITAAVRLMHLDAARVLQPAQPELERDRCRAAAASSSTKLSTAKQLAGLPGERIGAGRSGASFSQCATTWMLSAA